MKISFFKSGDNGNIAVKESNIHEAYLMSIVKNQDEGSVSKEQAQFLARHFGFMSDVRDSETGQSWNIYKLSKEEYAPKVTVDIANLEGFPS